MTASRHVTCPACHGARYGMQPDEHAPPGTLAQVVRVACALCRRLGQVSRLEAEAWLAEREQVTA